MTGELVRASGRRNGKTRQVEEAYEQFTYGFDTAGSCGCGVGMLIGHRADGAMDVIRQDDVRCARHDVVVGEVVVVRELT